MFDVPRLMAAIKQGLVDGLPPMDNPTDAQLMATVVALGMPKWSAAQMVYHPGLRLQYYMLWCDVQEAAKGNQEAKNRVDAARSMWSDMRRAEVVADRPDMSVGFYER
jgi:hypothetical protein